MLRSRRRQVCTTVRMRSTKRQPTTLLQPKLRRRHNTARRTRRSMKLFVGSTPSTRAKVHNADSRFSRFTQNFATRSVVAQTAFDERFAEASLERRNEFLEPASCDRASLERVPRREQVPDDAKPAATHEGTWAAAVDNFSQVPFQMCPAQLAALLGHLQINMPAIAMHNAFDVLAENGFQPQGTAFGVDDEHRHTHRRRRPQPAQFAPQFPTRLVGVLDPGLTHRLQGLAMRRLQRGTHFLFQVRHRPQRDRRCEDRVGDVLDAPLADAVTAAEIGKRRGQARPHAMRPHLGRDRRLGQMAATPARPPMSLILGHLGHDGRQFHHLKPLRLRIVRPRFGRQNRAAPLAGRGHDHLDSRHSLGRQKLLEMGRMPRLSAALALGLLLDDRRLRPQRIGGGRRRRIAGVGVELGLDRSEAPLQLGNFRIPLPATWARRFVHAAMLQTPASRSCASFPLEGAERLRRGLVRSCRCGRGPWLPGVAARSGRWCKPSGGPAAAGWR